MSSKLKLFLFLLLSVFFWGMTAVLASSNLNLDLTVYTCNNDGDCDTGENDTYCSSDCTAVCGNGVVNSGEECDNGVNNGACPASCSASCSANNCGGPSISPLSITNVLASDITPNTAKINWTTNNSALCQVAWGINTDYSLGTVAEVTNKTGHSTNLTSLSPDTAYHFKISCSDIYGDSEVTGDNEFITSSTLDIIPPGNVLGLRAVSGNQHIILYWTNPTDADFAGVIIRRSVDYFPSLSEGTLIYDGQGELSGSEVNFDDLNLNNGTLYYYSVFAYDTSDNHASGVGTSGTPNQATTTLADVSNLRIVPTDKKLTLYWTNPEDPDFAGVIIRRSTVSNPTFTGGALVYDGTGYAVGDEFSFPNTGLTNGLTYYYTVFAYRHAGDRSGGVSISGQPLAEEIIPTTTPPTTTPPIVTTTPPTTTPPITTTTKDLLFRDFDFYQNGQSLSVKPEDSVEVTSDNAITINLKDNKALPNTAKMALNLSVNGKVETYLFNYAAEKGVYSANLPGLGQEGRYWATIVVLDRDNKTIKTVYGWVEVKKLQIVEVPTTIKIVTDQIIKPVQKILKPIQEIAQSPAGQTTAAATVAISVANIAIAVPWWNWWYLLQFIFTQPFQLFFRRKGWGVVYNSITKKPVDLALVRLYDAKTNKLIASKVTDHNGRYMFLVDEGEYYLQVEKPDFDFPSQLLKRSRDDGSYLDLYYGDKIGVEAEERMAIVANIPIDQREKKISDTEIIRRFSKERHARYVSWAGPIIAVIYLVVFPSWLALGLVVVHSLVLLGFRRLSLKKAGKNWGIVYDIGSKKPLKKAITRIFSSEYGRMLEFYVTDNQGRYGFLVGDNKYYVTADKEGYNTSKTPIIDLTKIDKKQELIAKDLGLIKAVGKESLAPAETSQPPEEAVVPKDVAKVVNFPDKLESSMVKSADTNITAVEQPTPTNITPAPSEVKIKSSSIETTTSPDDKAKPPSPPIGFDLGSINELKENLDIGPETDKQKRQMDVDNHAGTK